MLTLCQRILIRLHQLQISTVDDNKPVCYDDIYTIVRLIRLVNDKHDDKLIDLLNILRNLVDIEELALKESSIFRFKHELKPDDFINTYQYISIHIMI